MQAGCLRSRNVTLLAILYLHISLAGPKRNREHTTYGFQGVLFSDRERIRKPTLAADYRIDPMPFKTEDFREDNPFVKEILKTGIRII